MATLSKTFVQNIARTETKGRSAPTHFRVFSFRKKKIEIEVHIEIAGKFSSNIYSHRYHANTMQSQVLLTTLYFK